MTGFEIIWACGEQELGRKTVTCEDLDAAVIAGWLALPEIARAARKPCGTITVRNTATGETAIEDVPNDPSPKPIWIQPLFFLAGGIGALAGVIWLGRHGFLAGGLNKLTMYMIWAFPMGFILAILTLALAHEKNRKVAEQWKKDFGDVLPPQTPDRPRLRRIVVARYSLWRILPAMALSLAIATACFWFPVTQKLEGGRWELWHPVIMALGAWFAIFLLIPLRQVLFEGRAALWIEGGEIILGTRRLSAWPIWGLREVRVGSHTPPRGLTFMALLFINKEGDEAPINARTFSEDIDLVEARLNRLLQLSLPSATPVS